MQLLAVMLLPLVLSAAPSEKAIREYIANWEGCRLTPYRDSAGLLIVGIGHQLMRGESTRVRTMSEVNALFVSDLTRAREGARRLIPRLNDLPDSAQLVVISLAFNLGESGLSKFTRFLSAINHHHYSLAAKELRNSRWYRQVGRRGEEHVKRLAALGD